MFAAAGNQPRVYGLRQLKDVATDTGIKAKTVSNTDVLTGFCQFSFPESVARTGHAEVPDAPTEMHFDKPFSERIRLPRQPNISQITSSVICTNAAQEVVGQGHKPTTPDAAFLLRVTGHCIGVDPSSLQSRHNG